MKALTPAERRDLRARAHSLDPVVSIAEKGLAPTVLKEIDRSLTAHELIKIRVYGDDREARVAYMATICSELGCEQVQMIGKLLVVYRPSPEKTAPETAAKAPARAKTTAPRTAKPTARATEGRTSLARPATKLKSGTIARNISRPSGAATKGTTTRKPRPR
ncbi:YhbY family RNA-binding protein [Niveibacterium sp. 24ML]|uniref:YhbY family RNA-binding protein n=1 Tax=Niveibacterium sp. 24ML TaxID=2985512 RepID=UPI0022717B97|nr:YhbY family RNA-binding protein [Niveibacterium sp. 24ML]MCX9155174.1 YhbY family RNA-binding protein [Niveibacterium sp. 24ML]